MPAERDIAGAEDLDDERLELVERWDDHMADDPGLLEVLEAFDPGELYVRRSRRSNWLLHWDLNGNRYLDPCVWSHNSHDGGVPDWAFELFEHAGVEVKR